MDPELVRILAETHMYPVLTRKQEEELLVKIKEGDTEALHLFAKSHLRLVIPVAEKYAETTHVSLGELVKEGVVGLYKAIRLYDVKKGYAFSEYATWWIRQEIVSFIQIDT